MDKMIVQFRQNELQTSKEIAVKYNNLTECYGLHISETEIGLVTEKRYESLEKAGRVEFGEGITEKLITVFRSSPYIWQGNYTKTIIELQDIFYYYKSECDEALSDDELLLAMERIFNGEAGGSTEYLSGIRKEDIILAAKEEPVLFEAEDYEQGD